MANCGAELCSQHTLSVVRVQHLEHHTYGEESRRARAFASKRSGNSPRPAGADDSRRISCEWR